MKKQRGLIFGLGLAALIGLSTREANAAPMTLTVFLNNVSVFTAVGTNTTVTANVTALNAALIGTGYSFSSLAGGSNFPGSSGSVGGFISDSGNLSLAQGGIGGVLKIVVSESGFTAPVSGTGSVLSSTATANYSGAAAGSAGPPLGPSYQTYTGSFTDTTPLTVTNSPIIQLANGTASDGHTASTSSSVPVYVTPYTLSSTTIIDLATIAGSTSKANNVFTGKTSLVTHAIPEPASLVMMLTGMPLPLVVMGLFRRRRAAA